MTTEGKNGGAKAESLRVGGSTGMRGSEMAQGANLRDDQAEKRAVEGNKRMEGILKEQKQPQWTPIL